MTQDKKQPIPLYSFTQWNNPKNVSTLLTAGADFMEQDDFGRTALHLVASSGNLANVQALLGVGADLMARDKWGKTPLHDAALSDKELNVHCLLYTSPSPRDS